MTSAPCKDCPVRSEGCHGRCQRYQEFARDRAAWLKQQHRKADMAGYKAERVAAAVRKWHTVKV